MINVQIHSLQRAERTDCASGEGKQERQGNCPANQRSLQFLPESHANTKRHEVGECPGVAPDNISTFEAQPNMFRQLHIGPNAEITGG
jgi:hypothetical protein